MPLTEKQKKHLRGLAHALTPVSWLGTSGVTEPFVAELDATLKHHELIKLKITAESRTARDEAVDQLLARTGATLITRIGNVAVLYRQSADQPRIELPT